MTVNAIPPGPPVAAGVFQGLTGPGVSLASTPKDVVLRDGTASLYRFRARPGGATKPAVLLVPSMINRWYVLDLRSGASLCEALVAEGFDVFCLDWGIAEDEDRYLTWDDVLARLARMARAARRTARASKLGLLGYCMGGTLAAIHAALHPDEIAALVNLAGPFDFSKAGFLGTMTDPRWFDPEAITSAGNLGASQMQSGFSALRPTAAMAKWVGLLDRMHDPAARQGFEALETWAGDNIPFPGAAYVTYIQDLYQKNALLAGEHRVAGKPVRLSDITCPVLAIAAERDTICPLASARALLDAVGSSDKRLLTVPGGHVGAVVGSKAKSMLYPGIAKFWEETL